MIRNGLIVLIVLSLPPAALAADGAALFKQSCVPCHAKDGSGNTPIGKSMGAKDLRRAEVQKLSDAAIAAQIREGKGKMPGFKGKLSAEEVAALVGHVRALAK